MKCQSHGSDGNRCTEDAIMEVFWPGETSCMCREHAAVSKGVADALGFNLSIRVIEGKLRTGGKKRGTQSTRPDDRPVPRPGKGGL